MNVMTGFSMTVYLLNVCCIRSSDDNPAADDSDCKQAKCTVLLKVTTTTRAYV